MATKPKNTGAATKNLNIGKEQESLPDTDVEAVGSAGETTVEAVDATPTKSVAEESGLTDPGEAPQTEVGTESSVPGALFADEIVNSPPAEPPARTRSAFGLIAGGLIAGAIGYLAATFLPNGLINQNGDVEASLLATADAQSARIDDLRDQVGALSAEISEAGDTDLDPLIDKVTELGGRVEALAPRTDQIVQQLEQLSARLESLEARPVISVPDGSNAMAAQLEAFRTELDAVTEAARVEVEEAKARATEIETQAAAVAADAQRRAALAEIDAALESGVPFANALSELDAPPDDLVSVADSGVPTLAELVLTFPELARSALSMAQDAPEGAGTGERLASFLRRQTNARSLSARDGDDVDAILSRAEAGLQDGELPEALSELKALPDEPRTVFDGWIALAESRVAAISAFAAISEALN